MNAYLINLESGSNVSLRAITSYSLVNLYECLDSRISIWRKTGYPQRLEVILFQTAPLYYLNIRRFPRSLKVCDVSIIESTHTSFYPNFVLHGICLHRLIPLGLVLYHVIL